MIRSDIRFDRYNNRYKLQYRYIMWINSSHGKLTLAFSLPFLLAGICIADEEINFRSQRSIGGIDLEKVRTSLIGKTLELVRSMRTLSDKKN